jgi:hypothetical protein
MRQATIAEVRLDAVGAARFSAVAWSTGAFERLLRAVSAVAHCSSYSKVRSGPEPAGHLANVGYNHLATIGALVALHGEGLKRLERERVERNFQVAGGFGLGAAEKQQRFAEIDAKLRRLCARRELLWREVEGDEIVPHAGRGGEYLVRTDADLEAIAQGKEVPA